MNEIINIGIATVDAIARTVDRFPNPKELIFFDKLDITTGGCAVNCAIDLAKMGIKNSLIVKLGGDMLGDFVKSQAESFGIDTSHVIREQSNNTAFSFAAIDKNGERSFLHTVGTNGTLRADDIDLDFIAKHKYCYIGGVMLMPALDGKPLAELLKRIRSRGVITIVDTVYVLERTDRWQQVIFPMLEHIDYFVPSEPEAQAITSLTKPEEIAESLQQRGANNIIVKLGEKGVYYRMKTGENGYAKAYNVSNVVDMTGAGDAWDAGFLAGLSMDYTISQACLLGNAVAAFCIQSAGASTGIKQMNSIIEFQNSNS